MSYFLSDRRSVHVHVGIAMQWIKMGCMFLWVYSIGLLYWSIYNKNILFILNVGIKDKAYIVSLQKL